MVDDAVEAVDGGVAVDLDQIDAERGRRLAAQVARDGAAKRVALAGGHGGAAAAERLGGAGLDLDEDEQASGTVPPPGALQHEVDFVAPDAHAAADDAQSVVLRLLFAEQFALRLPLAPEPLPRGRTVRAGGRRRATQTEPGENACKGERHAQRTRRGRR